MKGFLRRWWWPAVKTLFSLAILGSIGWRFWKDLSSPELFAQPIAVPWLLPAALCYLGGLTFSALYWRHLMRRLDQPAPLGTTLRAYFIGQLGKYVPGKALALVLRAGFMRGAGTSVGLAGLTAFYEVLVTMAAGAILAVLLFVLTDPAAVLAGRGEALSAVLRLRLPEGGRVDRLTLVLLSLGLCAAILGLIYPAVLNRLVKRVTTLFRLAQPPRLRTAWLGEGLLMTAPCWVLFGAALACALQAVAGGELGWTPARLGYVTAAMALAYVAGFVIPVAPGGLGVREFFLLLLTADLPVSRGQVALAVLLLRLCWTAAEVALAGGFYFLPAFGRLSPAAIGDQLAAVGDPPERERLPGPSTEG